jgi:hypothetical protein
MEYISLLYSSGYLYRRGIQLINKKESFFIQIDKKRHKKLFPFYVLNKKEEEIPSFYELLNIIFFIKLEILVDQALLKDDNYHIEYLIEENIVSFVYRL